VPHSPLITPAELAAATEPVTVLDVRWQLGDPPGLQEYRRGHIPGAVFVDLESDLADPPGDRGRHPLPEAARFEAAMRRCGVRSGRPVVVYDATGGAAAARAWWLLRHHGHPEVRVLDGGWQAWLAQGGEGETADARPAPGDFVARPGAMPVLDAEGAARVAHEGLLVDARAGERFRGEIEPVDPVAGHIPGAVNVPFQQHLAGPTGPFKEAGALTALYAQAGVAAGRTVGVYCGSGVTAAHGVLALEVIGVEAALYPGSWSEWTASGARPVALGGP
jgi:thiosulfate/3-mercaptopyruvate sulfurtransferase